MSEPHDPNGLPVLLLIHGTSAAHDADQGDRWWQEGGFAWKALEEKVGKEVDLPDAADREIFHWTGLNGERARHQAAMDLLQVMVGFERQGRSYHLIGHSHGGSVIWLALQKAVKQRWTSRQDQDLYRLRGLRSWSTVGTPFLQFQNSVLGLWPGKVVGALTLLFVAAVLAFMAWHLDHRFELRSHWQEFLASRQKPEAAETVSDTASYRDARTVQDKMALRGREQVLETGDRFRQAIGNEVLRVSNVTRPNTVFDWILLSVIGVAAPILASSVFVALRAVRIEAKSVRREHRVKHEAFLQFGDRWLGIWSSEDEAINGLRGSLRLSGQVIPRINVPKKRVFVSDRIVQFHRGIVRNIVAPIFNRLIAPSGDDFLWGRISKTAQGHDRPGCALTDVTEGPLGLPDFRYPAIPEDIDRALIQTANERLDVRAGTILTRARSALSQYAWGSAGLPVLLNAGPGEESVMHGDELVHTSYFHHPEILALLALHIREHNGPALSPGTEGKAVPVPAEPCPWAGRWGAWLANFKAKVRADVLEHPVVRKLGLPRLGHPNHLATVAFGLWVSLLVLTPLYVFLGVPHPFALLSAAAGVPTSDTLAGLLLVASIVFLPLVGFVLSFPAARRAEQGALRGGRCRFVIEASLYAMLLTALGFGGWWIWDRFFSKADPVPDLAIGFRDAESTLITSSASTIKLRHLATGRVRATIDALNVRSVATSADQNRLAYATESTIHLIDIPTRKAVSVLEAYGVKSISLSPNGALLASGHGDGTVKLWYTPTASQIGELRGHRDWVRAVAFSPDETMLASGGDDRSVRLWDLANPEAPSVLAGHTGALRSLAFHPQGTLLASGATGDEMIRLWDVRTGQPVSAVAAHPGGVRSLDYHPGGIWLASGGEDQRVRVWNTEGAALTPRHQLLPHPAILSSVAFDLTGEVLASRCRQGLVRLWNPDTGRQVRSLTDVDAEVIGLAFLPDSNGIFLASDDVHARVVNPDTSRILTSVIADQRVHAVAVDPQGKILATADATGIRLWDAATGEALREVGTPEDRHADDVFVLAFSPDGAVLASGGDDNVAKLWDTATGTHRATLPGHGGWVRALAFSPDGSRLATGSHDASIRLWTVADAASVGTLSGHAGAVHAVAFRGDGAALVSGGADGILRVWDPATGEQTRGIAGAANGEIAALAFHPDSAFLAVAGADPLVRVWNLGDAADTPVLTLQGHALPVTSLAYDPDGSRLVSGSRDYTVRVWDSLTGALLNIIGDTRR
jgi:WD40 repeat protein